jgi:hypothetical protein
LSGAAARLSESFNATPPCITFDLLIAGQVKMIVLNFYRVRSPAFRTGFGFTLPKPNFADMFTAASYFNTKNLTIFA